VTSTSLSTASTAASTASTANGVEPHHLADATLVGQPGCSHAKPVEQPEAAADQILRIRGKVRHGATLG
jgi:hypothetical protein